MLGTCGVVRWLRVALVNDLVNFFDKAAAVEEVDDVVVADGAEVILGQVGGDAGVTEHLRAVWTHFGVAVLLAAQLTPELPTLFHLLPTDRTLNNICVLFIEVQTSNISLTIFDCPVEQDCLASLPLSIARALRPVVAV